MLNYCRQCVMPDTKPDLSFDDDGVCNACRNYEARENTDWDARAKEFAGLLEKYRSADGRHWDCIIPVSGGKDSTAMTLKMLDMDMNPLCVTSTTCDLSDIGRKNIENIKNLGVDYIEFSPNPVVRRRLNRIGLTQVGDISWPEHVGIFTIPVNAAVRYRVPLIVWGENSQNEYGGPAAAVKNNTLNRRWLEEFGGLLGMRTSDITCMDESIAERHLIPYTYPADEDLREAGVTGLFLGYYFPWDGYANAQLARKHGFTTYQSTVEGSVFDYENLDNHQTGIHDYFKFLKFGFGRATDIVCLHIRRGRLSRQEGLEMVRKHDGRFPWSYLGKPLADILAPLEITVDEFIAVCDRFTNKKLFVTDAAGNLVKDADGNLTKAGDGG
ncbi:MAG: N-acetyl sugar amidotransferase [Gammaproteobacteria bacterium]|nr:N-acetyl sugar amidotransferase [Gammaproteobacteria bacterium]